MGLGNSVFYISFLIHLVLWEKGVGFRLSSHLEGIIYKLMFPPFWGGNQSALSVEIFNKIAPSILEI